MKAFVMQGDSKAGVVNDRPLPKPRPGYVGVKVSAIALNPTDWKSIARFSTPGLLVGCDFAGVVEDTNGTSKFKKGDRIAGMAHGANVYDKEDGAFAEHIVALEGCQMKVPANMSDEDAATLGVGVLTCGQGLFQALGLNLPNNPTTSREIVLIYGGSTATGTLGIQFAKLAGYTPIVTCSPRNFELVKSLGAAEAFDYNDPACAEKIKAYTNNNLRLVWDTISLEPSINLCAQVIASGGSYASLLPAKFPRSDVKSSSTLAYLALGPLKLGAFEKTLEDVKDEMAFAPKWIDIVDELLAQGKLKVHPPKLMSGGLDNVQEGLTLLQQDKVSGQKLVYKL